MRLGATGLALAAARMGPWPFGRVCPHSPSAWLSSHAAVSVFVFASFSLLRSMNCARANLAFQFSFTKTRSRSVSWKPGYS
jgi:enterochelin esterase-like enzyme